MRLRRLVALMLLGQRLAVRSSVLLCLSLSEGDGGTMLDSVSGTSTSRSASSSTSEAVQRTFSEQTGAAMAARRKKSLAGLEPRPSVLHPAL